MSHARRKSTRAVSRRPSHAGYSLVEVLAASLLLFGVLLSIMTMFVAGGQQINSGKQMSQAVAIAEDILEEYRRLGFFQSYQIIDDTGDAATDTRYVWESETWTAGGTIPAAQEWKDVLDEWKRRVEGGLIDTADATLGNFEGLPKGSVTITVRGLSELGLDPTEEAFADAPLIQIMVSVRWTERRRDRSVVFETLKS